MGKGSWKEGGENSTLPGGGLKSGRGRLRRKKYLEKQEPHFSSFIARKPKPKLESCGSGNFCASQSFSTHGSGLRIRHFIHQRERGPENVLRLPVLRPKYTLQPETKDLERMAGRSGHQAGTEPGSAALKPELSSECDPGDTQEVLQLPGPPGLRLILCVMIA